ncbi:hypothetical protein [Massilia cavernae]|uniref:Uncharacterized protein n=1 Tax=Massilia cavernae TaxID=2320864 RepID=A0A418Y181_9BURK|nr:hypothetical protein [Massilia cavernae]RJG19192.1 hypothetical protein D3872_08805 [Massilia cavernae]
MRLPGTRYQEHGWEHVRKLLGHCSLQALAGACPQLLDDAAEADSLAAYLDAMAESLHTTRRSARASAQANSYGDTALELALALVCELQARPADWSAFRHAVAAEHARCGAFWDAPGGEAALRKKANDMFAVLRDKVDSDNYQAACGRPCSPNRIYAYRMLDTAAGEIARIFAAWHEHPEQVAAILGREPGGVPIEARQMRGSGACRAEWVVRWSASLERFGGGTGPLHTKSKRFASLKNSPDKIQAMLAEIGEYEELSSNGDCDRLLDAAEATEWIEDLWRVLDESDAAQAREDDAVPALVSEPAPGETALASAVCLPPGYMELARSAKDGASWTARTLAASSLPVYLAVYLKMMGGADDTYPDAWLDPTTGQLPTMQQLAMLDQVSLPTLRKRRDQAIARLLENRP